MSVSDIGGGMSAELLSRAFEPFFTSKPSAQGTGLGLSVCRSLVERAGGFMVLESEPGRGTTARVYLPLDEP